MTKALDFFIEGQKSHIEILKQMLTLELGLFVLLPIALEASQSNITLKNIAGGLLFMLFSISFTFLGMAAFSIAIEITGIDTEKAKRKSKYGKNFMVVALFFLILSLLAILFGTLPVSAN
jgi:hypothetical protein